MRLLAVLPLLSAIAAFVLSLLCIFAGDAPNFLEGFDLLTLNTSTIGQIAVNTTSSGSGISGWLNGIGNTIEGDLNGIINDLAQKLEIHEFYSAHLLDFCEGYYTPGPIGNATTDPSKNVTSCSNRTAMYTFNPTTILENELKHGISLADIKWPSEITDAITAVEVATKAMFVLYCIAVVLTGVAIIGALYGIFAGGKMSSLVNTMVAFMAFLTLTLASTIVTIIISKIVNAVNQHGNEVGVFAYKGTNFLIITWVAMGLMFLTTIGWVAEFCLGRRKEVSFVRDGKGGRY